MRTGSPPGLGSFAALLGLYLVFFVLTPYDLLTTANAVQGVDRAEVKMQAFDEVEEGRPIRKVLLGSLGLAAAASFGLPGRRRLTLASPAAWAGVAFVGLAALSPLWSDDPGITGRRVVTLGILAVLSAAIARFWTDRECLIGMMLATAATLVMGVVSEVAGGGFTPWSPDYRFAGLIHPNGMAGNCGLLVLTSLGAALAWPAWRGRLLTVAGLGFAMMLLTKSRGTAAGVLAGMLVFGALSLRPRTILALGLGAAIVLVSAVLFDAAAGDSVRQLLEMGRSDGGDIETLTGRTELWDQLLGFAADAPVLGYGYDSFWLPRRILAVAAEQGWVVGSSHSGYLDVLLSLGLVGAILWGIVLVAALPALHRRFRWSRDPAALVGLAILVMLYLNMTVEVVLLETSIPSLIGLFYLVSGLYVAEPAAPWPAGAGYPR